tara:strand:- start:158 stop:682 length:525 start_codon:yes stop_codon:yes gene_type:complete
MDKHHLKPKHRGGTDDDGLVEVTKTCHAMFHFCEFQLHGMKEDFVAWKALAGQMNKGEIAQRIWKGQKHTPEAREKISKKLAGKPRRKYKRTEQNRLNSIAGAKNRKRPPALTENHRRNQSLGKRKANWGDMTDEEIRAEKKRRQRAHSQKPEVKARRAQQRIKRRNLNRIENN